MNERRPIPSCPNYEAGSDGRIYRNGAAKPLSEHVQPNGYVKVSLWHANEAKHYWAHRLICASFHGPAPTAERMDAAHLNGVRTDNRPENLAWKTRRENMADMDAHGTRQLGERRPNAILTEEKVRALRAEVAAAPRSSGGKRIRKGEWPKIAAAYGITSNCAWNVCKGNLWGHVK